MHALGETHPDTGAIDAELRRLSTSVGDGASTILVTGVSGAGKTRLVEAWIRGDAAAEPHRSIALELYRLPLRRLVPFGRRTVVAVVPGAESLEKDAILDRTTGLGAELLGDLSATVDDLRHGRRPRSRKQPARRYWA